LRPNSAGQAVPKGIHPSNVEITKIKMDKDRKALIARKLKGKEDRAKRFPAVA
jgi:large subunit ribosomal protein L26e